MLERKNKSFAITTNLQGVKVTHRSLGNGVVISHETSSNDSSYIKVRYDDGEEKEHKYPDVFLSNSGTEPFLVCIDKDANDKIFEDIKHIEMAEVELAEERYNIEYEKIKNNRVLKDVKFEDFVLAKNDFRCKAHGHSIQDIIACIQVLKIDIGIETEFINGWYCNDCNKFYIDSVDYKRMRHKGILLCKNMTEEAYIKNVKNNSGSSRYDQESVLHQYGYNVSEQEGLTDEQRWAILAVLVDNGVLDREWIKSFLRGLIYRFGRQNKDFSTAIEKWSSDIDFISGYRIDSLIKVGVRSIR